jgi:hypothetical protein
MKRHPHETTVLGLFKNPDQAHQAINSLEPLGYDPGDISLIASKEAYEREELVNFIAGEKLHEESIRAGKIGGIAGAIIAGATAITAMISGGASLLVAGPVVAIISGAGGLLGSLLGTGFTEEEAKSMDNAISHGDVLVVVHAANRDLAHRAKEALHLKGAHVVHVHH